VAAAWAGSFISGQLSVISKIYQKGCNVSEGRNRRIENGERNMAGGMKRKAAVGKAVSGTAFASACSAAACTSGRRYEMLKMAAAKMKLSNREENPALAV
jgi:hypothetical protein